MPVWRLPSRQVLTVIARCAERRFVMGEDQERGTDEQATSKPNQRNQKLTDLADDKRDKDVKGGGGTKIGGSTGDDSR